MSRVGSRPIVVPAKVQVRVEGNTVTVKGPKGELSRAVNPDMSIALQKGALTVSRPSDSRDHRSLHGFTRSIVANMIEGVDKGFRKNLELHGVGYRAQKSGESLSIQVGFSHPVEVVPPPGITFLTEAPNQIAVVGIDKELVGKVAAQIREIRPPDLYLGKGIRYAGEQVRRKAGKAGKLGRKK